MRKKFRNHLAADQCGLTPMEKQTAYPRSLRCSENTLQLIDFSVLPLKGFPSASRSPR